MSREEGGGGGGNGIADRGIDVKRSLPGGIEANVVIGVIRFGGRPGL